MKAVIDSDVLIDFLQGLDAAAAEIDRYEDPCYSVISWMEVMIGAETDAERFAAETLFDSLRRIELSAQIATRAVDLHQAHPAISGDGQAFVEAEARHFRAGDLASLQYGGAGGHLYFNPVDR